MGRRILILVAAGLVAVLGTSLVFVYLSSGSTASASEDTTTVFTAKAKIDPGTPGAKLTEQAIEQSTVPASTVPPGAVRSLSQVSELKVITTIFPGQVLITSQFAANNSTGGLPVPAGKLGIAVQLGDPERVANFVQPGSKVTIYDTGNATDRASSIILRDVTVLAIGQSTMSTQTHSAGDTEVTTEIATVPLTLAVTDKDGAKLSFAAVNGHLYFALQPA